MRRNGCRRRNRRSRWEKRGSHLYAPKRFSTQQIEIKRKQVIPETIDIIYSALASYPGGYMFPVFSLFGFPGRCYSIFNAAIPTMIRGKCEFPQIRVFNTSLARDIQIINQFAIRL